ncbi:MAG: LytTR family DNA-binding domain-containing protein [Vagococcus sp.]|uniref:LytTR family DNA-binding domain-containing protein n=1 Tax=Vagococcus sp. TaxID=1933889 RepID=UPI002FC988EB
MKINFSWDTQKETNVIDIISHPDNKTQLLELDSLINKEKMLLVTSPSNSKKHLIPISNVESISAMGHLTKVTLIDQSTYFLQQRLKELIFLEDHHLYQINQSTIVNLRQIKLFQVEKYARLELITLTEQSFIVSRHYAKTIKERLTCINN